jgi:hypothetical protein
MFTFLFLKTSAKTPNSSCEFIVLEPQEVATPFQDRHLEESQSAK